MVRDLAHVVVEIPPLRVFRVRDPSEGVLHHGALAIRRSRAVRPQHRHGYVARVAVENHEAKRVVVFCVPARGARQFAKLALRHGVAVSRHERPTRMDGAFPVSVRLC